MLLQRFLNIHGWIPSLNKSNAGNWITIKHQEVKKFKNITLHKGPNVKTLKYSLKFFIRIKILKIWYWNTTAIRNYLLITSFLLSSEFEDNTMH